MTPTEKALELMEKFNNVIPVDYSINDTAEETNRKMDADYQATKECALLAAEEMLAHADGIRGNREANTGKTPQESYTEYWQQVKEAIIN